MKTNPNPALHIPTATEGQLRALRADLTSRIERGRLLIRLSNFPLAWVALGGQIRKFERQVKQIDRRLAQLEADGS